jgi:integrase
MLDYARARGWRKGDNPARWRDSMKRRLPNVSKVKRTSRHPALPWQQIGAFMAELRRKQGMPAKALAFAILTAARSGEVRWGPLGRNRFGRGDLVVPGERMKVGKEHRAPLSKPALAILADLRARSTVAASLVLPSTVRTRPRSDMALSMLVRRMDEGESGPPPAWRGRGQVAQRQPAVHSPRFERQGRAANLDVSVLLVFADPSASRALAEPPRWTLGQFC